MAGLHFAKVENAGNDFVIIADHDGAMSVTAELARRICDRHRGIGADGVIRAVRLTGAEAPDSPLWFMDHLNSDGTIANMCGNGLLAYMAYLEEHCLVEVPANAPNYIMTRAGLRSVCKTADGVAGDLGAWNVLMVGSESEDDDCFHESVRVTIAGLPRSLPGVRVDVGVPHTVVRAPDRATVARADFSIAPIVVPPPADGSNVELLYIDNAPRGGHGSLVARVHERGIGETQACGTGAVASAIAARLWSSDNRSAWDIAMPGGSLKVEVPERSLLEGASCRYLGTPSVIAEGVFFNA